MKNKPTGRTQVPLSQRPPSREEFGVLALGQPAFCEFMDGVIVAGKLIKVGRFTMIVEENDVPTLIYKSALRRLRGPAMAGKI